MQLTRYRVEVPPAETKRFRAQPRTLTVRQWDGWETNTSEEFVLAGGDETLTVEFEVFADAEPDGQQATNDSLVFCVTVKFKNSTGTRTESLRLTPTKI